MQPVLPTNLDRASAQVLGFDAAAYITDTKSTLNQRLGIPATFNSGDYLAGSLAKPQSNKKSDVPAFISGVLAAGGLGLLTFLGIKGKIKLPKKIASRLPKISGTKVKNALSSAKDFFGNIFKGIKSKFNIDFSQIPKKIKGIFKKVK